MRLLGRAADEWGVVPDTRLRWELTAREHTDLLGFFRLAEHIPLPTIAWEETRCRFHDPHLALACESLYALRPRPETTTP